MFKNLRFMRRTLKNNKMDCFIKRIFLDRNDEQIHSQFIRFGKGIYNGRAALSLWITGKIKLGSSFEFANDFVNLAAEFPCKFSGIITSKDKLGLTNEKLKSGVYSYEVVDIDSSKVREIADKTYFMLLDAYGSGINLKMKKKLPKPGKSGDSKIDDKFCVLEADLKYWNKIKESFFWDINDCKKAKIVHEYHITDLVMPKNEKDFVKIRLLTKRKGKIKRKIDVDGQQRVLEKEFEA